MAGLSELFTNIANAIRTKTGSSEPIVAMDFPETINSIPVTNLDSELATQDELIAQIQTALEDATSGADTSVVTATAEDVLSGKIIVDANGTPIMGTMPNNGKVTKALASKDEVYTVPKGYHDGTGTVSISSDYSDGGWITGETTADVTRTYGVSNQTQTITLCTGIPFEPDYFRISDLSPQYVTSQLQVYIYDKLLDTRLYVVGDEHTDIPYWNLNGVGTSYNWSTGRIYNDDESLYPTFAYENGNVTLTFWVQGGGQNYPDTLPTTFTWAVGKRA